MDILAHRGRLTHRQSGGESFVGNHEAGSEFPANAEFIVIDIVGIDDEGLQRGGGNDLGDTTGYLLDKVHFPGRTWRRPVIAATLSGRRKKLSDFRRVLDLLAG